MEQKLKEIYYDTTNAASFGNGEVLFRSLQLSPKKISDAEDWMRKQNVHTLHKSVTRKFQRRKVIVGGIDHQWQCDLVDVKSFKNRNGKAFHPFLKSRGVEWFSTRNMETKATIVERFNRTLMEKLA
jgi:hypothetical protein